MSDEKPFAVALRSPFAESPDGSPSQAFMRERGTLVIGGRGYAERSYEETREDADRINAAVEQREAKLRGAIATFLALPAASLQVSVGYELRPIAEALDVLRAALGPNPPDYVPAEKLRAAEETIAKLKAAVEMIDPHDERLTVATVKLYLEQNGFTRPIPRAPLSTYTNAELSAETTRRINEARIEHIFADYIYGHDGKSITMTGRSFCGLVLTADGTDWRAVTEEEYRRRGGRTHRDDTCRRCETFIDWPVEAPHD